uniref:Uncharacterized protein n=1 Tax=Sphaerodactylus townsendi TaxID=933632 RepID=A0ACB8F7G8_9SAUR
MEEEVRNPVDLARGVPISVKANSSTLSRNGKTGIGMICVLFFHLHRKKPLGAMSPPSYMGCGAARGCWRSCTTLKGRGIPPEYRQHRAHRLSLVKSPNRDFCNNVRVQNSIMTRAQSRVIAVGNAMALCCYGQCSKVWRIFIIEKGTVVFDRVI